MSVKFFQAKVAFEIPAEYEVSGPITRAVPDELVERLMDLFDDCEFESAGICNPPLLIVNTHRTPTQKWLARSVKRIKKVLKRHEKTLSSSQA